MKRRVAWPSWCMLSGTAAVLLVVGCGGRTLYGVGDAGSGSDGGGSVGECQDEGDCVVAWRADQCCSCYEPVSAAELASDPCLIVPEQSYIPEECWVDCFLVDCAPCPDHDWTVGCQDGECAWLEGECIAPEDCVVGIRVDDCCTRAMPVSREALEEDPCLVSWPIFEIPEPCSDQWAEECMYINCTWSAPSSRAVTCGADGCEHTAECFDVNDCTLVLDGNTICPCPEGYPAEMLGRDDCVVPAGAAIPMHCPANQVLADCGPCWEPDGVLCTDERRCEAVGYAAY